MVASPREAASNSSHTTAVDLIATTNGTGNVKGVACQVTADGNGIFPSAVVKFHVNGGAAQTITLTADSMAPSGEGSSAVGYTGWVPFNVRFSSSIRITIQKASSYGSAVNCAASWGLD